MKNLIKRVAQFRRVHGTRKMIREISTRLGRRARAALGVSPATARDPGWVDGMTLARSQLPQRTALRVFNAPAPSLPRVNLVTDSINAGSLYGGVGTAIIVACELAHARGASLRVITRSEPAQPSNFHSLLSTYGLEAPPGVEFAFAPFAGERWELDLHDRELFITTSWWTTEAALRSVPHDAVLYLLQEDERMFYPLGDEHLLCSRVLAHPQLRFAINSRLLFDHLVASGLDNVARNGLAFEPAFPSSVFYPRKPEAPKLRRTLAFYARPNNSRNLFHFGLELLESAIARGVLCLDEWDVVLIGKDIPRIRLDGGRYTPAHLENLSWPDYAAFVGTVDLGLSLMYTPHPSYPPFDMSASGAVVVTNRFANKQDLSHYCANILCGDPQLDSMLETLARGITLARDDATRAENHRHRKLPEDWQKTLAELVARHGSAA
jgi:hypothetical protein